MPSHHTPVRRADLLGDRLDHLVATFDISTLAPDPLELVLRYSDPLDQEVVALIASAFAYGRADIAVRNVSSVLSKMGPSPFGYLAVKFETREARDRFRGFAHRFHKTEDLVALLGRIAGAVRRHGSLGELFKKVDREDERDIGPALTRFVEMLLDEKQNPLVRSRAHSLRYLLTSPADGSACKRMNLFLRWMVRRESPDLGLWKFVDPARLVIPLDTHVHRISRFLGLTKRKSADWKTARSLTDRLARFNAADPVRYDFAICRLGILDLCSRRRKVENCAICLLRDVCRFPLLDKS